MEAEKTFQKFVSPQPAAQSARLPSDDGKVKADAKSPNQSYDTESRTQMERLIRSNQ